MAYDLYFLKTFGIKTKIKYLFDVTIKKKDQKKFYSRWKRFYSKNRIQFSPTREDQIEAFYKKLKKLKDDQVFCRKVDIRFIDKKMGYGVFAKEDISKYTILNHYAGILRPDRDVSDDNDSAFTFPDFEKYSIDAQKQGNWTRFMNHSENTNVKVWEYYLPEGPRIIFTAGPKGIKKSAQLTYSYGDIYWDEEDLVE